MGQQPLNVSCVKVQHLSMEFNHHEVVIEQKLQLRTIEINPSDGNMDHHQDKITVFLTRLKTWKFCSIIVRHSPMEKSGLLLQTAAAN